METKRNQRRAYGLREKMMALSPPRVILAEDDADVRSLIAAALRGEGYGVLEAQDGTELVEGIDSALLFGSVTGGLDAVALVISDIRMPGHTGLEVLAGLRRAEVEVAVILVTAYADAETRDEARRLGADALVSKPFELEVLLSAVHALAPVVGGAAPAPSSWRVL